MEKDTIAAISTAQLPAGIAVLRLSGPDSINIADKIFSGKKSLKEAFSHNLLYGNIIDGEKIVDDVLISVMKGPNTYTGEDVVEISCHGSLLIQKRILSLLVKCGSRLAGPGEYTMRAFMNGRMDLSQAESVMDLINSENEFSLKDSRNRLSGEYSALIDSIRQKIIYEIAYIESALDDPEHISLDGYSDRLSKVIDEVEISLKNLVDSYELASVIRGGIDCAIIGRVNVGKSSLLNCLTKSQKAIVTDIPGTTRDAVEQKIQLGDISLNLIDTAGIREADDEVEIIGIERSRQFLESASLVLLVLDSSSELTEEDKQLLSEVIEKKAVIIFNKTDLPRRIEPEDVLEVSNLPIVQVSAKNLQGFEELTAKIEEMVFSDDLKNANQDTFVANERHLYLLREALVSLNKVKEAMELGLTEEIFTVDLTDAYDNLGRILGKKVEEDVINEIFSKFCIGK